MNNSENLPTDNNNKSIVKGQTMYNWETHDNQDKVIVDSINAIERRREHMPDSYHFMHLTQMAAHHSTDVQELHLVKVQVS